MDSVEGTKAMGFELPIDVDFCDHPKVIELTNKVGKRADIFPLRLFLWAAKFAKDGVITGGCKIVEMACRWDGKPGVLHAALVEVGFIEQDGKTIHDWMDHAGRKVAAYERKKNRDRDAYRKRTGTDSAEIPPRNSDVSQTFRREIVTDSAEFRNVHPINETKRNETKRNETETTGPPGTVFSTHSISDLAQKAAFLSGKGTKPTAVSDWYATISDLVGNGISAEQIDAELEKTKGKDGRNKSEPPWEFKARMMKTAAKNGVDDEFLKAYREAEARNERSGMG